MDHGVDLYHVYIVILSLLLNYHLYPFFLSFLASGIAFPDQRSHPLPMPTPAAQTSTDKKRSGVLPNPPTLAPQTSTEKKRSVVLPNLPTESQILASPGLKSFLYTELCKATQDFCPENLVGEGGFGCVYKGWLAEDTLNAATPGLGMAVAVKKLTPQGFQGHKEWLVRILYKFLLLSF